MARVYWTLEIAGAEGAVHRQRRHAGLAGGQAAGCRRTPVKVAPSSYAPTFDATWLSTREDVQQSLKLSNAVLVDSRPDAFYQGETQAPAAKLAGTLPGAVQLDFNQWFEPKTALFVDTAKAQQIAAQIQVPEGQGAVAFCNTGHWAATDWFGLSEVAGIPNVKLYAGSMVDWTAAARDPAHCKTLPAVATQLARAVQGRFNNGGIDTPSSGTATEISQISTQSGYRGVFQGFQA